MHVTFHGPSGRLRAPPFGLQGGGIAIYGPGGTATLINTNVYSNEATYVCWPFLPLPRPFFQCPDEMFCRLLAFFLAGCGALHLWHGNANQLKRVRERGTICVLAF